MKRSKSKQVAGETNEARIELSISELKEALRSGVLAMCTATGLTVLQEMMEADVTALVGPRGKHNTDRIGYRHGTEQTSVVLGGRRVGIKRPRVRSTVGDGELAIETYEMARREDLLLEAALGRML